MIATFLVCFAFFALVIAMMAVGAMMGRDPIKGSCGGVGAALGETDYVCDLCGNDPNKCEEISSGSLSKADNSGKFYSADK